GVDVAVDDDFIAARRGRRGGPGEVDGGVRRQVDVRRRLRDRRGVVPGGTRLREKRRGYPSGQEQQEGETAHGFSSRMPIRRPSASIVDGVVAGERELGHGGGRRAQGAGRRGTYCRGTSHAPARQSSAPCALRSAPFHPTSRNSSSLNSIVAANAFSSRCFTRDVPGIGSITGERFSSHASAICAGVAWCFLAMR